MPSTSLYNSSVDSNQDYQQFLATLRGNFTNTKGQSLFTTSVDGVELWQTWLNALPDHLRQEHNCHACRRFVERIGNLAIVGMNGELVSALFNNSQKGLYGSANEAVYRVIKRAKITGVFLSSDKVLGMPQNRDRKRALVWHHMAVENHSIFHGGLLTADQRMAELKEDHATLCRALVEFDNNVIGQALQIVQSEALARSEKFEGRLQWLKDLSDKVNHTNMSKIDVNAVWQAVATAPAGFCHVKSSMIGTLLEDLFAGKSFDTVKKAFNEKMHPLKYQRPTAPASAGNIAQAEKIVEQLGLAPALKRRYARFEDILKFVWHPTKKVQPRPPGGVFGHLLTPVPPKNLLTQGATMTWDKFSRTILPSAEQISVYVGHREEFHTLTTASDPSAPPIIQWDSEKPAHEWATVQRNPVSWYTYPGSSVPSQWNLSSGYHKVNGICPQPNQWQEGFDRHGKGVLLVIEGCRDTAPGTSLALFPEHMKKELHSVRSTIESFSKRGRLEDQSLASAAGLVVRQGGTGSVKVRVLANNVLTDYTIDRWD